MIGPRSSGWLRGALALVAISLSGCDVAASTQAAQSGLQARDRALDLSAQTDLRNALVAAKTVYMETSSYDAANPSGLRAVEPTLCFVDSGTQSAPAGSSCSGGQGSESVSVLGQGQDFGAAVRSQSGKCFWIRDSVGSGTAYGTGEPCTGSAALQAANPAFPA